MRPKNKASASSGGVPSAVLYRRVSSDEQAETGTSLAAQLAETRRYALAHEWLIDGEYEDVMSGRRDDRPAYRSMLDRVRALHTEGRATIVVVAALDRLGRDLMESCRARKELKALGVG